MYYNVGEDYIMLSLSVSFAYLICFFVVALMVLYFIVAVILSANYKSFLPLGYFGITLLSLLLTVLGAFGFLQIMLSIIGF